MVSLVLASGISVNRATTALPVSYRRGMSAEVKQLAVDMYLEGLGFRSIGRILKCSHVSVYKWIKKAGQEAEKRQKQAENEPPEDVEIDEMHSFVGSKDQACWIWIAVDRIRKRFIDFVIGDRSAATGNKLWQKMQTDGIVEAATDHWKPYELFIPPEIHVQ